MFDQRRNTSAEITLNWNLFNGGSDTARVRQAANLVNQAADVRDKTCRDTRQTAEIAFNDTRKLAEQVAILDRNVLSIEKARDAYRQQFDIGQRSLLDLLNAENELFTAKRARANAEYDLGTAQARTQAALQQLTAQLGLARIDAGKEGRRRHRLCSRRRRPRPLPGERRADADHADERARCAGESARGPGAAAAGCAAEVAPSA